MKIAVIGAGAMGGSFVEGLLKSETFKPSDIPRRQDSRSTHDWVPALPQATQLQPMAQTSSA